MRLIINKTLYFCLTIVFSMTYALAEEPNDTVVFNNYNKVTINGRTIHVDRQLKHIMIANNEKLEEYFDAQFGDEVVRIECGKVKVYIGFSYGPSEDPNFNIVVHNGNKVFSRNVGAQNLSVSAACQFYASGHTDNNFNIHRKFTITKNSIEEIIQPFYLVDKTCHLSAPTTLTTEKCGKGSVVAKLPKGSEVKILVSEWFRTDEDDQKYSNCKSLMDNYLVSTPFGLVGWVENNSGTILSQGVPLSCIYWNGD